MDRDAFFWRIQNGDGEGRIVKRGKEVCFLSAELFQEGELVASATATAIIRRSRISQA